MKGKRYAPPTFVPSAFVDSIGTAPGSLLQTGHAFVPRATKPADSDLPQPQAVHHRDRRRRKRRHRFALSAWLVFYVSAALGLASGGLVYLRGAGYLPLSIGACLVIVVVLVINERNGFTRSRRMRRTGERRVKFEDWEVVVLFGLLLLDVFLSALVWVG